MNYSSTQAAKKLGLTQAAISKYIKAGKIPEPKAIWVGNFKVYSWTERDINRARNLLPKIANGRKTRYQKLKEKQGTQPRAELSKRQRTKKKK